MPSPPEFDRYACITIQGGGVYGLSLLGQLQAVHEQRYKPVALAGTSAGAIVAALYWSGLTPDIVREHLLRQARQPRGLLGLVEPVEPERPASGDAPRNLADFHAFTERLRYHLGHLVVTESDLREGGPFVGVSSALLTYLRLKRHNLARDVAHLRSIWEARGIVANTTLMGFLDGLLRRSPAFHHNADILAGASGRLLRFRDFRLIRERGYFFPTLFLTATNLTRRSLELINSVEPAYDDWPVAQAMCASAGFPGFFRPVEYDAVDGEYAYVDGGVIANFPAFIFTDQFRQWIADRDIGSHGYVNRPWVHVGIRLTADKRNRGTAGEARDPKACLDALKELVLGQARNELEEELLKNVPRSITVSIPFEETGGPATVLGVQQLRPSTVEAMFHNGYRAAREALSQYSFALPAEEAVEAILRQLIASASRHFPEGAALLRANVFVPQADRLVLRYRANMPDDRDDPRVPLEERNFDYDMNLDIRHGLTGLAFIRRRPLLCNLVEFASSFENPNQTLDPAELFGFTPDVQATVRRDRTWLLSVPIFDPETLSVRDFHRDQPGISRASALLGSNVYVSLERLLDGAIFGVLNLDAGWDYTAIGLPESPRVQEDDCRIQAIVDHARLMALRLGTLFSQAFAATPTSS